MADKNFMSYTEVSSPASSDSVLIANGENGVRRTTINNLVNAASDKIINLVGHVQLTVAANGYTASDEIIPSGLDGYKIIGITCWTGNTDVISGIRAVDDRYFKVYAKNFSSSQQEPYIYYSAICKKV